jgi:hypothetical protein
MSARGALLILLLLSCLACAPVGSPAPEQLYVAPMKLQLREQLGLQAKVSGIALHGDRAEVLERRRRFVRIRVGAGTEGWVDGFELLNQQQWAKLERLATQSAAYPVQAVAAPLDAMNVHTDPNRDAPSFYVAAEEEAVEIVGHIVTPRVDHDPRYAAGYDPTKVPEGAPLDDWHLIRVGPIPTDADAHQAAGWVLSRLLYIRVPDAVTQQANGAPIAAALSLGKVVDPEDGTTHDHWLMATATSRNKPYEFDTLRVMPWNSNRHRYDVMFLQKDLVGFYPIQLEPPGVGSTFNGFNVTVEVGELQRERRHYTFPKTSNRPKLVGTEMITMPKPEPPKREDYVAPLPVAPVEPAEPPYWQRVRSRWHEAWGS